MRHGSEKQGLSSIFRSCKLCLLNNVNQSHLSLLTRHMTDGIKKFNCSVNRFMSEFGSLQTVVKNKLFHQYCCALYGSQLWPLWHDSVNKMCIQWRNALRKV